MAEMGAWIDFRLGLDGLVLQEHFQPYTALTRLSDPGTQCPQMVTLIGLDTKRSAISSLDFGKSRSAAKRGSEVRLLQDPRSANTPSPVFFADCELHASRSFSTILAGRAAGDVTRRSLIWWQKQAPQLVEPVDLANLVYAKLLSPFSTVICIFADDFNNLATIARTLASWLITLKDRPSDLPHPTRPQVLILRSAREGFDEGRETRDFLLCLGRELSQLSNFLGESVKQRHPRSRLEAIVDAQFSRIRVVSTPILGSSRRPWKSIRSTIINASLDVHKQRQQWNVAFTATHFKFFFHAACDHFCRDIVTPFSFVRASRLPNPVPAMFSLHIGNFIKKLNKPLLHHFAIPIVASALALDSFPPGMHFFSPTAVFEQLYQDSLQNIAVQSGTVDEEGFEILQITEAIGHRFCAAILDANDGTTTSLSLHQNILFKHRAEWATLFSNTTCFACLARGPENSLGCGHALCDHCTVLYGCSTPENPWTFTVAYCPLCGTSICDKIKMKPPTAGVRMLSIDGGGVRGISSIAWLKELQSVLRLPMLVQDHFDIAVGTSSGALTILGLFINSWSAERCDHEFVNFAKLAFRSRMPFNFPFLKNRLFQKVREIVFSLMTDSQYGSKGINGAIQGAYGSSLPLFNGSRNTKIAITGTTTETSSTVIFSNYNGGDRPVGCGYSIFRPADTKDEMLTWEAARITSAAPPFFGPYRGYHDGGLGGHNNPVNLGLWEQNLIWRRRNKQPDAVVSVGTGSVSDAPNSKHSWMSQLFLPRLIRSFMSLLDGQKTWIDLLNNIPPQYLTRYHRLNLCFQGEEPKINEVQSMRDLKLQVRAQAPYQIMDLTRCADTLLASLFYLELDSLPRFDRYTFKCSGRILCRLDAGTRALHALVVRLRESQARFYLQSQDYITCVDRVQYTGVCSGEAFQRLVSFDVLSLDDEIDFRLGGITQRPRSISNFPYTITDLIEDQRLNLVFGRPDHKRPSDVLVSTPKRRKLK